MPACAGSCPPAFARRHLPAGICPPAFAGICRHLPAFACRHLPAFAGICRHLPAFSRHVAGIYTQ
eukprot:7792522-Alexandrium_andersonii.AAC.1